jgi:nicotinamide riboside kinase
VPTIAVLGGECSGKTTLAADLGGALDALVISEELRAFVDRHGRTPLQAEQAGIMAAQRAAIELAQESDADRWIISDPAPAMTAIYSQMYFDDDSLWQQARTDLAAMDYVFWCDIDLPWIADGLHRDGPHMRRAAHRAIADLVVGLRTARNQPVSELSGPRSERADHALRILRE